MKSSKVICLFASFLILFTGYTQGNEEKQSTDLIGNPYPEAQAEVKETLTEIFTAIQERDAERLLSFHAYGPKFTEFKNSLHRTGSTENEAEERGLVAAISGFDYKLNDLKIDVFGEVAKVTFHADFRPTIDGQNHRQVAQATLLFVKLENVWKIVHEHLSPLTQ